MVSDTEQTAVAAVNTAAVKLDQIFVFWSGFDDCARDSPPLCRMMLDDHRCTDCKWGEWFGLGVIVDG